MSEGVRNNKAAPRTQKQSMRTLIIPAPAESDVIEAHVSPEICLDNWADREDNPADRNTIENASTPKCVGWEGQPLPESSNAQR